MRILTCGLAIIFCILENDEYLPRDIKNTVGTFVDSLESITKKDDGKCYCKVSTVKEKFLRKRSPKFSVLSFM